MRNQYMELFKAHEQWKIRPSDERFTSVAAMAAACANYRRKAITSAVPYSSIRAEAVDGDIQLVGRSGATAVVSNWAFGQLSSRAGAPASYLRSLPATLAVQNLNHGLKERAQASDGEPDTVNLLMHHEDASELPSGKNLVLRSALTEKYSRIWNDDICRWLEQLQLRNPNWVNPLAYKVEAEGKDGNWPKFSNEMVPSGLYASDHDMFAFLVDESRTIETGPSGLHRGFFVWNSEVGAKSFGIMSFLYDRVCGNNIVWGAKGVQEFRIRHVGDADARGLAQLAIEIRKYSESSASDLEAKIESAKLKILGATREHVVDNVMDAVNRACIADLTNARVKSAAEYAEKREDRYGNPRSVWGIVGALTELSQDTAHADQRVKIDRAAGKLLQTMAF